MEDVTLFSHLLGLQARQIQTFFIESGKIPFYTGAPTNTKYRLGIVLIIIIGY